MSLKRRLKQARNRGAWNTIGEGTQGETDPHPPPQRGERFLPRYSEQIVLWLFVWGRHIAALNSLPVHPVGLLFIDCSVA